MKTHMREAHAEKLADHRVMRRLQTDSAYKNAEDAEAQAAREDQITAEVWAEIEATYVID